MDNDRVELQPTTSALTRIMAYTHALENITSILLAGQDIGAALQALCTEVAKAVPGADMVGITVLDTGAAHPKTAASTDARVNDVDADQYRAEEGPCLEAARTQHIVRVRVDDVASRWPKFAANVAGLGVKSYLSAPITLDDEHLGAVNVYSYADHGFSDMDEMLMQLLTTAAEAAVRISRRAHDAQSELDGLMIAMKSRAEIEQAKGVIMAVRAVGAEEAFKILTQESQNRNIKVTQLAASTIASVTQPSRSSVSS